MKPTAGHGLTLALLFAAAGCDVSRGATPPTTPDDIDNSATPITTFTTPASAGCPAPRTKSVLVDPTHDGGVWWFPQTATAGGFHPDSAHQGRALAMYLRSLGYTVTELARGATLPADSLMTYATVIRAGYYYDAAHPGYSDADRAAYAAYTACDRTLVILAEYLKDGRKDDLAEDYGLQLAGIESGSVTTFESHTLTAGVGPFSYIAGSTLTDSNPASVQVLGRLANGKAVMGLVTMPDSRVFFMGDMNGIQLMPQPLVDNLIAWGFK